ncbi:447_t:CDS:10, partial [Racocetra fulgida]
AENSSAYFSLIDEFLGRGLISSNKMSDRDLYNQALDIIESGQYLSVPTSRSFLEFALSLHTTAPAIQAYYHYYNATVVPSTKDYIETHEHLKFDPDCDVWVDWYGNQACSVEEFKKLTGIIDNSKFNSNFDIKSDAPIPKLLPFDHVLQYDEIAPLAVLYANLYSPSFLTFHKFLSDLAKNGVLSYVLRYRPPKERRDALYLSGYGVELALKNTDYIVVDDRKVETGDVNENDNQEPMLQERPSTDHLFVQQISEIKPLTYGEIKAAQFVLEAQKPLLALSQLSQDFPKYSGPISQITLNSTWEAEVQLNQQYIMDIDKNSIWINGLSLDPNSVDPFSLGLSLQQAVELLASPIISESKYSQNLFRGVFDVRDKSEKEHVVVWLNDLEKEIRYAHWPHRIYEIYDEVHKSSTKAFDEISREIYNRVVDKKQLKDEKIPSTFEDIVNSEKSPVIEQIEDAKDFVRRFQIKPESDGVFFVNGKYFDMDEVYVGEINDITDIYDYFMTMPGVPDRRNSYIFISDNQPLNVVNLVIDKDWNNVEIDKLNYIYSEIPMTILIISDFNQKYGAIQGLEALKFLDSSPDVRISLIHNPSNDTGDSIMSSMIYYLLYEVADLPKHVSLKSAFEEFLNELSVEKHIKNSNEEDQIPIGITRNSAVSVGWQMIDNLKANKYWKDMKPFIKNLLKLGQGETAFIVGPINSNDLFTFDDFELLTTTELTERINPVIEMSIHDLDNIRLANLDSRYKIKGVDALFELKNILIEGHAFDITTNSPPSGLQLLLGTNNYPAMVDTIVMANLGYLQLKANPGVWTLRLREGKSKEIYDLLSVGSEGWFSRSVSEIGNEIVLNSFEGLIIYPRLVRKPGKENVNIKDDENDDSFWDYFKNKYKILFLDVLFPLDLDKVIFVDADQIVRTDLKELIDMDLKEPKLERAKRQIPEWESYDNKVASLAARVAQQKASVLDNQQNVPESSSQKTESTTTPIIVAPVTRRNDEHEREHDEL